MPHIHTEPGQHDHTASAHVVRIDMDVPRLLLIKHKKLGMLLQPGGHIELDETPWQAISHELREETGYEIEQMQVMQPKLRIDAVADVDNHPVPIWMNTHRFSQDVDYFHTDTMYLLQTAQPPRYAPHDDESQDLRWLSVEDIEQLPGDEIWPNTQSVALQVLRKYMSEWVPVMSNEYS